MTESADRASFAADHMIGNLYFNLDALPILAGVLSPEVMRYAVGGNAAIAYSEMCRLLRSDERLSAGSLEAGLKKVGFDFNWLGKLQSRIMVEGLPTLHNYATDIINHAELLKVQQYSQEAIKAAQEDGARAAAVKGELLAKLSAEQQVVDTVQHTSAIGARVRERLKEVREGKLWGVSTGFKSLDQLFLLVDGEMVVIAARPSQGKTSLMRMIFYYRALEIAKTGENGQVIVFSSDDTADKFMADLACTMAEVDSNRIRRNKASNEEWERFYHEMSIIESIPLYIDDTQRPTVEHMYYKCAMLNAQKPVRLGGQDYAGLIQVSGGKSERQDAELAFSGVKGIGSTLRFPWVQLSQVNKAVEGRSDKWVTPSDLMYAGEPEANVCLTIMRPEHYISRGEDVDCEDRYKRGVALVNVGKNKSGQVGVVPMAFRAEYARFSDLAFERRDLNDY